MTGRKSNEKQETESEDEAGVLMQKVQSTLLSMDEFVQTKNDVIDLISHDLRSPINRNLGSEPWHPRKLQDNILIEDYRLMAFLRVKWLHFLLREN